MAYTLTELKNLFVIDSFIKGSSTFKQVGKDRFQLSVPIDAFEIRNLTRGYNGESKNLEKLMQEVAKKLHIKEFENNNLRIRQYIENVLKDLDTPEAAKMLREKELIDALIVEYNRGTIDMDSIDSANLTNLYDSKFAQLSNEVLKHRRNVQQQERDSLQAFEPNRDIDGIKDYYLETFIRGKAALAFNNPIKRQLYLNNDVTLLKEAETQGLDSISQKYSNKYLSGEPLDAKSFRRGELKVDEEAVTQKEEQARLAKQIEEEQNNLPYYEARQREAQREFERIENDPEAYEEYKQQLNEEANAYYAEQEVKEFIANERDQLNKIPEKSAGNLYLQVSNEAIENISNSPQRASVDNLNSDEVYIRMPYITRVKNEPAAQELFGEYRNEVNWGYIKVNQRDIIPETHTDDLSEKLFDTSKLTLHNNQNYEVYKDIQPVVRAGMLSGRALFEISQEVKQNEMNMTNVPPISDDNRTDNSQMDTDRLSEDIGAHQERGSRGEVQTPGSFERGVSMGEAKQQKRESNVIDTPYDLDYGRNYNEGRIRQLQNENIDEYDIENEEAMSADNDEFDNDREVATRRFRKSQRMEQKVRRAFHSEGEGDELDKLSRSNDMEGPIFSVSQAVVLYSYLDSIKESAERFNREMEAEQQSETITIALQGPEA